jgi:putative membrane protein
MNRPYHLLLAASLVAAACAWSSAHAAAVSGSDASFMKQAAEAGSAEIEGSKLAEARATSADVKSFAGQMVADHGKVADELKQLADSKGVKLPAKPSVAQRTKLKLLSARKGEKFDRRYADSIGVEAHEEAVKLFRTASTMARDADVKAFAVKTLPGLEHHLEMAKALQVGAKAH